MGVRDGASPSAPAFVRCFFFFFRFLPPPLTHRAHACELHSTKLGAFVFFTRAGENNIIIIKKKAKLLHLQKMSLTPITPTKTPAPLQHWAN